MKWMQISVLLLSICFFLSACEAGGLTTCREPQKTFDVLYHPKKQTYLKSGHYQTGGGKYTHTQYFTTQNMYTTDVYAAHYREQIETTSDWIFRAETLTEDGYTSVWDIDGVCKDWQATFTFSFEDKETYKVEMIIEQP